MYRVLLTGQAEVFFPSFDRAIRHLKGQIYVSVPEQYISETVECGNVFRYSEFGTKEATMEKIQNEAV